MSHRDREDRAEGTAQREADDVLVQLERKLHAGQSVDVQDVRKAWRTTRYPRAMVQVLAQRRRSDLAVRAASIVGIDVDPSSPTWRVIVVNEESRSLSVTVTAFSPADRGSREKSDKVFPL